MIEKYNDIFKYFQTLYFKEISVSKVLGNPAFGNIRDLKYKNKTMAGEVIENENKEESEEIQLTLDLRGSNIIRIDEIFTTEYKGKYYNLVIMEKAIFRDLGKLNEYFFCHNLLKLIYDDPFDEKTGDNLLRYYAKQIINALEVLERNNIIHLNIKPENLLITRNIDIKLANFSSLRRVDDESELLRSIEGFNTPEYYSDKYTSSDNIKKTEYFDLGASLFALKYGFQLLKYIKKDILKLKQNDILDLLLKKISFIKSNKIIDKDFMKFLISLIQFKPENRPSFEYIYRNKWLNKNSDILNKIHMAFEYDEEKIIMELQKNDFLMKKEKQLKRNNNNSFKFHFKKK